MKETKELTEIDDSLVVAYLLYRGHKFKAFRREDGRVSFRIEGDVSEHLKEMHEDAPVNVNTFLRCIRNVKGRLFTLKSKED